MKKDKTADNFRAQEICGNCGHQRKNHKFDNTWGNVCVKDKNLTIGSCHCVKFAPQNQLNKTGGKNGKNKRN